MKAYREKMQAESALAVGVELAWRDGGACHFVASSFYIFRPKLPFAAFGQDVAQAVVSHCKHKLYPWIDASAHLASKLFTESVASNNPLAEAPVASASASKLQDVIERRN